MKNSLLLIALFISSICLVKAQKPGSGEALEFNGTSDYISVSHNNNLNADSGLTIEAWIKASSWAKAQWQNVIVSKDGWASGDEGYTLRAGDNGKLSFNVGDGGSGGWHEVASGSVMKTGQWYHVAGTFDGTTLRVYINGIEQASAAYSGLIATTTYDLNIGRITYTAGGTRNFAGEIDEVKIWDKALSATELRAWMCKKTTNSHPKYSELLAYYKFDGGTGTSVADSSGNGHTGTINGASWLTSGAAIGDASSYDYTGTIAPSYTHSDGSVFSAIKFKGSPGGAHVYIVNDTANATSNKLDGVVDWSRYYGVFIASGTNPSFTALYDYSGNNELDDIANEERIVLGYRDDNSGTGWSTLTDSMNLDTLLDQVEKCGQPRHREFIGGSDSIPESIKTISICEGDSIQINGIWRSETKVYVDTYTSSLGCDSTIITSLIVNPTYRMTPPPIVICEGDSALIFSSYQKTARKYSSKLTTQNGCDSFVIQELIVNPVYTTTLPDISICKGEKTLIFGVFRSTPGIYYKSLNSVDGCDSTLAQPLVYSKEYDIKLKDVRICSGDSSKILGVFRSVSGVYSETYTANSGCDSVVTQELFVDPNYDYSLPNVGICEGDSIFMLGQFRSTAGIYTGDFKTERGCDSTVTQELEVNKTYSLNLAGETICKGDSIMILGKYEFTEGLYTANLNSIFGCDSVVTQFLTVSSIDTAITVAGNGELTAVATGVTYQWIDCTSGNAISGETSQKYLPLTTGSFAVILENSICTDTSECYLIDVTSNKDFSIGNSIKMFPNPVTSNLQVELNEKFNNVYWKLIDVTGRVVLKGGFGEERFANIDMSTLSGGTYFIEFTSNQNKAVGIVEKMP